MGLTRAHIPRRRILAHIRFFPRMAGVLLLSAIVLVGRAEAQSWTPVGDLNVARSYHTATPLLDGRVLVAGGSLPTHPGLSSAEIYDPITQTWTPTGSMQRSRCAMAAVRLLDGRVLVSGGRCGAGGGFSTNTAEIYNPATGTWTLTPNMNRDRTLHTATLLLDGRVLVAAGYSDGGFGFQAAAEIYNPVNNTWTPAASMGTGRWQHTATLLTDGRVLVAAGENYAFCNITSCAIKSAEIYNPVTGAWNTSGNLNFARVAHGAELLPNGKVLVAGGLSYSNFSPAFSLASAELFDPTVEVGVWTSTGSLHDARHSFVTVRMPDGKVLVAGGGKYTAGSGPVVLNGAETYDPNSGGWIQIASLNEARYTSAGTLLADGTVLVSGGHEGSQAMRTAEVYGLVAARVPATLTLDPAAATNPVDTQHCVTATVKDASGNPVPDITVRFTVTGAVNTSGSASADTNGQATFCYQGPPLPGTDAITAYADTDDDSAQAPGEPGGAATKAWIAGAPATLTLSPATGSNPVNTQHCVTATVMDAFGNPTPNVTIRFNVAGAITAGGSATTDANGQATFCYSGPNVAGADAITAFADTDNDASQDVGEPSGAATKTWVVPLPTLQDQCKNGGWKTFGIFKNQGDCVSFVSTGGQNPPANLP
jgi:N-acetylneuraminic acid mutarotase